jgi:hypothetical protein
MNVNMTELVMGGLHAAQSCTQREFKGLLLSVCIRLMFKALLFTV